MRRPRTKLISLRMSEEEYQVICAASNEGGARCVSEFVRSALLGSARQPNLQTSSDQSCGSVLLNDLDQWLQRVEQTLAEFERELHVHLSQMVGPK
jgi:hypothetical protein